MRVQIVLFDGVEEQDFAGPYEVFSYAGRLSGGAAQVAFVSAAEPRVVTAAFGTRVAVAQGWSPAEADVIVVPGGGFGRPDGPGIWAEINAGSCRTNWRPQRGPVCSSPHCAPARSCSQRPG
ncbi:DJ-1/PfpI family protein [Actinoplanes sp. NPDC051470]|uniref:DJ-1/PfpI family protein n=1 Tax=Actinoplanes sp. NPDC051470 TaxID=3157224 RepID=UPI003430AC85